MFDTFDEFAPVKDPRVAHVYIKIDQASVDKMVLSVLEMKSAMMKAGKAVETLSGALEKIEDVVPQEV